jgi:nitrite reductase (NADH) large subunit
MSNNIVIIGGGIAAVSAVKAIREIDDKVNIYLFQNEKHYPYYRLKLTKSLFDNLEGDKILIQKREWYESNNVNLYLDKEVVGIDNEKCEVIINDGTRFGYDKLLLANGSHNFTPNMEGIEKNNVYTIRKLDDIKNIKESVSDKKTVLNIGGGIQGLETVWTLHQNGKNVIIAEFLDRLMPRQLDKRASKILQDAIESLNIKILLKTAVEKIVGEDSVKGFVTNNGDEINCDMVIYSVGVRSNKSIVDNTTIKTNFGVLVNDKMQTNIENIYAAGDIAELTGSIGGLWSVATEQGKVAGYNIVDKDTTYMGVVPTTTLNAFNISLFSAGDVNEENYSQTIIDDSLDGISYKRVFIKDNKIVGAILIGDVKNSTLLKSLIEKKVEINNIDLSNISIDELLLKLKNTL